MRSLLLLFLAFFGISAVSGQVANILQNAHAGNAAAAYDPELKPFYHGVASGDPLQTQVILWTRVTPDSGMAGQSISGDWYVATDTGMTNVVRQGTFTTDSTKDFTVKVDVTGLTAGSTYYYMFSSGGANSLRGKTKTLPQGSPDRLKFGVVSCNNYEHGYFNAFRHLANRKDLDAIIHLGDYIYEYDAGTYGDSSLMRFHQQFETVTKSQYRARYSLYRLDPDLRAAHQQHVFINIWDDHESANDSWKDGAQNHQSATEGPWSARKSASNEVFFEWLPIRDNAQHEIYRSFQYGDLVDLIMLDTRLEGRNQQLNDVTNPALYDTSRTILGSSQRNWFIAELDNSAAKWRVIGNQVIFAQVQFGWAAAFVGLTPAQAESQFLDIWDGYPAERQRIITHLDTGGIDNTVFITGDFHSSFAFDIADTVVDEANNWAPVGNYDPATGAGSVAVEFATPSISSANFDENLDALVAGIFENQINSPIPGIGNNPNPHMKYVDLDRHGYFILDVRPDSLKANYYYTGILQPVGTESFGTALKVKDGENHLITGVVESEQKTSLDIPAPAKPLQGGIGIKEKYFEVFSIYPNPAREELNAQLGLLRGSGIEISITDMQGKTLRKVMQKDLRKGIYEIQLDVSELPAGTFLIQVKTDMRVYSQQFLKK